MATLSIGRHPDCDIVLDEPTVSRRHAEVSEIGLDLYLVADHGSTSGSFRFEANGWQRFTSARLRGADRLRLGLFEAKLADLLRRGGTDTVPPRGSAASRRVERDPATGEIVVRQA